MTKEGGDDAVVNPFKRCKLSDDNEETPPSELVIGTHSGTFQADEALGVWMLRQLPEYHESRVVRSRDSEVHKDLDIVIDVGGVYDHDAKRYDHHQRGFDERFDEGRRTTTTNEDGSSTSTTTIPRPSKLSASGLVYRHYGRRVIARFYPGLSETQLDEAHLAMYDAFVECTDAVDTGVEPFEGGNPRYVDRTGLSSRVSRRNPRWNEVDPETGERPDENERFAEASAMCGEDFLGVLADVVESRMPARKIVERAVRERRVKADEGGEIVVLASGGLPWRKHLYDAERSLGIVGPTNEIKFVLYPDQTGMWRVQAVTVEGKAFENRLSLPEEWRGVRDEDLTKVAGIPGCVFCHAAGFIGGNQTYEGALEMAREALRRRK